MLTRTMEGSRRSPIELGRTLAEALLDDGADAILAQVLHDAVAL